MRDTINVNARYVVLGDQYEDAAQREAELQTLLGSGHVIVWEMDTYTVLENTGRTYG